MYANIYTFIRHRTLEDRAARLLKTKGVPLESLDSSLFAKSKNTSTTGFNENHKQIAFLEAQIYKYADLLMVIIYIHVPQLMEL